MNNINEKIDKAIEDGDYMQVRELIKSAAENLDISDDEYKKTVYDALKSAMQKLMNQTFEDIERENEIKR